jgi:2-polyprenyl-3-methyl-5-hydroxy-6-metoxy-1,4-benzoquinol methylase
MVDFYDNYNRYKSYGTPDLHEKIIHQFDREFWLPVACTPECTVLEIGCGTGLFLSYLKHKKVKNFIGIDSDNELKNHIPDDVLAHFRNVNILDKVECASINQKFDRIIMFDVLEHFEPNMAVKLLHNLASMLNINGSIIVRLPNASSPWGLSYQFGDLTHHAAYSPLSLRQLALAGGFECVNCFEQISGSPKRRLMDKIFHKFLSAILMSPPEIWSANFFGILERSIED